MTATEPPAKSRLVNRMQWFHDITVADLLDWCAQHDVDPATARVTGGHIKWQSPELPAESDRRIAAEKAHDARQEAWERDAWERLSAKFGTEKPAAKRKGLF